MYHFLAYSKSEKARGMAGKEGEDATNTNFQF